MKKLGSTRQALLCGAFILLAGCTAESDAVDPRLGETAEAVRAGSFDAPSTFGGYELFESTYEGSYCCDNRGNYIPYSAISSCGSAAVSDRVLLVHVDCIRGSSGLSQRRNPSARRMPFFDRNGRPISANVRLHPSEPIALVHLPYDRNIVSPVIASRGLSNLETLTIVGSGTYENGRLLTKSGTMQLIEDRTDSNNRITLGGRTGGPYPCNTPGDFGGPLFDAQGQLVGIHAGTVPNPGDDPDGRRVTCNSPQAHRATYIALKNLRGWIYAQVPQLEAVAVQY